MRNVVGAAYTTIPDFKKTGQIGAVKYDNNLVYNIGASGFAIGLDSSIDAYVFDRDYNSKDPYGTSRYSLGFFPQVKYNFSDKLNLTTSLAMSFWNSRAEDNMTDLITKRLSARTGLGWAIARDIYFSPFLNYYPQNFDWKTTTVSFATVFSVL
ncbi:hypothetical protein D3C87_1663610 [compost metagenome]